MRNNLYDGRGFAEHQFGRFWSSLAASGQLSENAFNS